MTILLLRVSSLLIPTTPTTSLVLHTNHPSTPTGSLVAKVLSLMIVSLPSPPHGLLTDVPSPVIVDALLKGVEDGNDILTLSLGGADGWTSSVSSVVASRIAKSGKIVTIAAGNDGSDGSWYTSSPGNGIDVISVGSVEK